MIITVSATIYEEYPNPAFIIFAMMPLVNLISSFIAILIHARQYLWKMGKCSLSHKYKEIYDSTSDLYNRGLLMRAPTGGYTTYECTLCKKQYKQHWSAFS